MKRVRRVLNRLRNRIQNRGGANQQADLAAAEPSSSSSSEAELQPSAPLDGESTSSVSEAELQPSAPPASDSSTSFEILEPASAPFSIYEDPPESPRAGPSSGYPAAFARCRPRLRPVLIDVRFPLFFYFQISLIDFEGLSTAIVASIKFVICAGTQGLHGFPAPFATAHR